MTVTVHEPLELTVLGDDLGFTEGPVVMADGTVYAVDIDQERVLRLRDGAVDVVATPGRGPHETTWPRPGHRLDVTA